MRLRWEVERLTENKRGQRFRSLNQDAAASPAATARNWNLEPFRATACDLSFECACNKDSTAAALKHAIPGDFNLVSRWDVEGLFGGQGLNLKR